MKCAVVGPSGMLGQRVSRDFTARGWSVISVGRSARADVYADLTDQEALRHAFDNISPDVVVNCAALTDLTECERNPRLAWQVNAEAPQILADLTRKSGGYFVQISTDHYFSGDDRKSHPEDAPVKLLNKYARTKYAGEQLVLSANPKALVVRTNILGYRLDPTKDTFFEWSLRQLLEEKQTTGFVDFFTSGMTVGALSRVLLEVAETHRPAGRWNIAGSQIFSKMEFMQEQARAFGRSTDHLVPGSVKGLRGAPRAESLGLDCKKIESLLGRTMPTLNDTMTELHREFSDSIEIRNFFHVH